MLHCERLVIIMRNSFNSTWWTTTTTPGKNSKSTDYSIKDKYCNNNYEDYMVDDLDGKIGTGATCWRR